MATQKLIKIDLKTPKGNAYYLLGLAEKKATELGYSNEKKGNLIKEMQSSDYENLLDVFEQHFSEYYELTR